MAKHVKVHKDVATSVEISVESLEGGVFKQLEKHFDSDGTVNWTDDNRYFRGYQVTGLVSLSELETLITCSTMVMGATYPKIDVYDKSAAPLYNTYSPVQILTLRWSRVTDEEWRVTVAFEW